MQKSSQILADWQVFFVLPTIFAPTAKCRRKKELMSVNNSIFLIGRLAADPEVKYSQGDNPLCIARFRLAVDRKTRKEEEKKADFIGCTAFGKTAECIRDHVRKGTKIAVEGSLQSGSYEKEDGTKVYRTEVIVEEFTFCESKKESREGQGQVPSQGQQGYQKPMQNALPQGQQSYPQAVQPEYYPGQPGYQQPPQAGFASQPGFLPSQGQVPVTFLNPNEKGFIH